MKDDIHFYDPAEGHQLPHDPFMAIVAPRLIGWISTCARDGRANLAPYSFFGAFATHPYVIGFASEGYKDSIRNAESTGEFVWNLVTRDLAERMNVTSSFVPYGVDEFELAGLEKAAGVNVSVPHVAASPAVLECKLLQVMRLRELDGKPNNWLALGQVVGVHIRKTYLKEGLFDTAAARPVMRAGYRADYAEIGEMFAMRAPRWGWLKALLR